MNSMLQIVVFFVALGAVEGESSAELGDGFQIASMMSDRTPSGDDANAISRLLEIVVGQSRETLESEAVAQRKRRIRDLTQALGNPPADFNVFTDLMRYPLPNRGAVVQITGQVLGEPMSLDPDNAYFVVVIPNGVTTGRVALVLPHDVVAPKPDVFIETTGIFAKRTRLEMSNSVNARGDDGGGGAAPLIVASNWVKHTVEHDPADKAWDVIRDKSLGVRADESELYYQTLAHAEEVPPKQLYGDARDAMNQRFVDVPQMKREGKYWLFRDLLENPRELRGAPVEMSGYAREVRSYPAGDNDTGISELHEIWMFTDDAQNNPTVIVTTHLPEGLQAGDDLQVPVRIAGYFFKLYGYHAMSKTRIAPMILAGVVEVLPEPEISGVPPWLLTVCGLVALLFVVWLIVSFKSTGRRPRQVASDAVPDFENLPTDQQETVTPPEVDIKTNGTR